MNYEDEQKRALIFLERKTLVHISTTRLLPNTDKEYWFNGIILEVGTNFFIAKDRVGGQEQLILFSELKKSLEPYTEKE